MLQSRRHVEALVALFYFMVSGRTTWLLAVGLFFVSGPAIAADPKLKIADPIDVTLVTADGVELRCTYFAGKESKKTVPLILVHGWNGQRGEYAGLAAQLQLAGHSVIVPDLRGHGDSVNQRRATGGNKIRINRSKMRSADFLRMINFDMEAVKKYLMKRNNEGKLNIELLGVIGAEEGALIAMNWTAKDWSYPLLPIHKQGQDVKAIVLLSPTRAFRGINNRPFLSSPPVRSTLSVLIIAGREDKKANDVANRLHNELKRFHEPQENIARDEDRNLFDLSKNTSVQGTRLLANKSLKTDEAIKTFVRWRLADQAGTFPWTQRTSPFGD